MNKKEEIRRLKAHVLTLRKRVRELEEKVGERSVFQPEEAHGLCKKVHQLERDAVLSPMLVKSNEIKVSRVVQAILDHLGMSVTVERAHERVRLVEKEE